MFFSIFLTDSLLHVFMILSKASRSVFKDYIEALLITIEIYFVFIKVHKYSTVFK